jgi:hypothetical protein
MSSGLWRCLALLIHLNYGIMTGERQCVLIDDIGEGFDFERSVNLVKRVIDKGEASNTQIIMASNDRFVLNAVPLKYWTVLSRSGSSVRAFNRENARDVFDDFRFTGLSNFDFFANNVVETIKN